MAGWGHLYVTMHGEMLGGWTGEKAQCGLRVAFRPVASSSGPIISLYDNGPVEQIYSEISTAVVTGTQTFAAGFPGQVGNNSQYTEEILKDIATDVRAYLEALKNNMSNKFRWTSVKIAPIERGTGKYLAPSTVLTFVTPVTGGGTNSLPPEVALCCSMRAPVVGKRGRGRMYFPFLSTLAADAEGKVASGVRTHFATETRTLIQAIEDLPGTDTSTNNVVVMSAAATTAVVPSEVRVGDHFDAQRRRQHQVDEIYTSLPL